MRPGRGRPVAFVAGLLALAVVGTLAFTGWREIEARWLLHRLEGILAEAEARPVLDRLMASAADPAMARTVVALLGPGRQVGTFWVFLAADDDDLAPALPEALEERLRRDPGLEACWACFCEWNILRQIAEGGMTGHPGRRPGWRRTRPPAIPNWSGPVPRFDGPGAPHPFPDWRGPVPAFPSRQPSLETLLIPSPPGAGGESSP